MRHRFVVSLTSDIHGLNLDIAPMPKFESDASAVKSPSFWGRVIHFSAYLPIVLAAVLGFACGGHDGVNIFYRDDWGIVPILYERYANGTMFEIKR